MIPLQLAKQTLKDGRVQRNPNVPVHYVVLLLPWRPQDFFQEGAIRGSEGRKSPVEVQGQIPGEGLGAPPEADNIFSK